MQYWQEVRGLIAKDLSFSHLKLSLNIPDLYSQGFANLGNDEKLPLSGSLGQFLMDLGFPGAAKQWFATEATLLQDMKEEDVRLSMPWLLAANLNDQGLALMNQNNSEGAIKIFEEAEQLVQGHLSNHEARRVLASISMNKANALRDFGKASLAQPPLERALELMKETCGNRSPEVATVMQGLGNNFSALKNYKKALSWHRQSYQIRREMFGDDHRDTALSLGNLATTYFGMHQYHNGMLLCQKSLEVFEKILGKEHAYTKNMARGLEECEFRAQKGIHNRSSFGLVLLIVESQPQDESPPDPHTMEGKTLISRAITDNLIKIWNDLILFTNSIPVLVITCPGVEDAADMASVSPIAKRFTGELLQWVKIPQIKSIFKTPKAIIRLLDVHNQIISWINDNDVGVMMVKPIANIGSQLDRGVLNHILQKQMSPTKTKVGNVIQQSSKDIRPITIEVVPYDGKDGPITGLYTGGKEPRSCVMPSLVWQAQKYIPKSEDYRATGTIYLDLVTLRNHLDIKSEEDPSPLDKWFIKLLLSVATSKRNKQRDISEQALSELMLKINTGQINFPTERGLRGFQNTSTND